MPYVHHLSRDPYPMGAQLTSADPEPCGGTVVRDAGARLWRRTNDYEHSSNWYQVKQDPGTDYETWTYVAGWEPVTVVETPDDWEVKTARGLIDAHG